MGMRGIRPGRPVGESGGDIPPPRNFRTSHLFNGKLFFSLWKMDISGWVWKMGNEYVDQIRDSGFGIRDASNPGIPG